MKNVSELNMTTYFDRLTLNNSPLLRSTKNLQCSIGKDVSICCTKFVPYIRERDGMGRLMKETRPLRLKILKRARTPLPVRIIEKKPQKPIPRKTSNAVPCVGTYYTPLTWIKPSFSVKKTLTVSRTEKQMKNTPHPVPELPQLSTISFKKRPIQFIRKNSQNTDKYICEMRGAPNNYWEPTGKGQIEKKFREITSYLKATKKILRTLDDDI